MNEDAAGVSPETLALDLLIKQTIERDASHSKSRLFPSNQHTSFPAMIIQDPVLEPVDKLVWMSIRLQAHEAGGKTTFPSYETIAKTANVSSSATISRALTILRLTRWLTLCSKYSETGRRSQTNIYALHDEPLQFLDVIYLDSGYQPFLSKATEHYHARVKAVAGSVLTAFNKGRERPGNVGAAEQLIVSNAHVPKTVEKKVLRRYFSFSGQFMNELRNYSIPKNSLGDPVQNIKTVENRVQNIKAKGNKIENRPPQNIKAVRIKESSLIYPKRLSDVQRGHVDRILRKIPVNKRQQLLDEMEGRIRAEQQGMDPLYDELNYLNTLCKAMKKGTFKFNLGIKIYYERQAKESAKDKQKSESANQSDSKKLEELRSEILAGRGPLADIRKILGMPNSSMREA